MAEKRLPLLMIAAAGLGALLWWDMRSKPMPPGAVAAGGVESRNRDRHAASGEATERTSGRETANPLAGLDKASLRDMTERPLFTPARRPPPRPAPREAEAAHLPPPASPSTPDYTLLGIIRDGDRAIALLHSRSDGRNLRIQAGDTIGGWEIAAVDTVSVRLKGRDGAAHELRVTPR